LETVVHQQFQIEHYNGDTSLHEEKLFPYLTIINDCWWI